MKYAITAVVRMLYTDLLPSEILKADDPLEYLEAAEKKINRSVTSTLNFLRGMIVSRPSAYSHPDKFVEEDKLVNFIPRLQRDTTRALNVLYAIFHTKFSEEYEQLPPEVQRVYVRIYNVLAKLLTYIHRDFWQFWEQQQLVPHSYRAHRITDAKPIFDQLTIALDEMPVSPRLRKMLLYGLNDLLQIERKWYYHDKDQLLAFVRDVVRDLLWLHSKKKGITQMLIHMDLGIYSEWRYEYYIETLMREAKAIPSTAQQVIYYHKQLTTLKQLLADTDRVPDEETREVVNKIMKWIELEIPLTEKVHSLTPPPATPAPSALSVPAPVVQSTGITAIDGINTSLTVHEYSMLIEACIKTGIIKDDFKTTGKKLKLLVKTDSGKELKPASLHAKLYADEVGPRNRLIDKLLELVNVLKKKNW